MFFFFFFLGGGRLGPSVSEMTSTQFYGPVPPSHPFLEEKSPLKTSTLTNK